MWSLEAEIDRGGSGKRGCSGHQSGWGRERSESMSVVSGEYEVVGGHHVTASIVGECALNTGHCTTIAQDRRGESQ
jgi:hypothetical protein